MPFDLARNLWHSRLGCVSVPRGSLLEMEAQPRRLCSSVIARDRVIGSWTAAFENWLDTI
jgi:hypothetical protein